MEQLGEMIVSKNLTNQTKSIYRLAARAIIYQAGKVLFIHSRFYHDYTLPGGGVENGENEILALYRECEEEAGAIVENVRPFYKTVEKHEVDSETYRMHESHFYFCDYVGSCKQHLESYEEELGYEPVWLSIPEAILQNEKKLNSLLPSDYNGVLIRELRILYKLKELEENGRIKEL